MAALTITASAIIPTTGYAFKDMIAGTTITAGQSVYYVAATGQMALADSNLSQVASGFGVICGVSLHAALAGQHLRVMTGGTLAFGAILTAGVQYTIGAVAAGDITPNADIASGWFRTNLFVASTTSLGVFNLNATGIVT